MNKPATQHAGEGCTAHVEWVTPSTALVRVYRHGESFDKRNAYIANATLWIDDDRLMIGDVLNTEPGISLLPVARIIKAEADRLGLKLARYTPLKD